MAKYRHEKLIAFGNERDLIDALNKRFKRIEEFAGDLTQDEADLLYLPLTSDIDEFFNGTFLESFSTSVSESAGTVTMSLEQSGGGDLTMRFSSGYLTLDCTPASTITLTPGTDSSPQGNWIYIPESTGVLTKSTSGWPIAAEHIKVAYFLVQSASGVTTDGGTYIHQNWNDHRQDIAGQGHMAHMAERIRITGAQYFSGIDGAGVDNYLTVGASSSDFKSTAGVVFQMHRHAFPAIDMSTGDKATVVNWFGDNYRQVSDLFEITADSTGTTIGANRYFNLVFWGVANQTGEVEWLMVNLPSGSYTVQADAEADSLAYDDFRIPREFGLDSSTGFLICRVTLQMGTTWSVISTVDLRGATPQTAGGGGAGTVVTSFSDAEFEVFDDLDNTKVLNLQLSGLTTATTRTLTVPDASGTIMLVGDAPAAHTHVESDITDLQAYLLDITGESIHDLSDVGASAGIVGNLLVYQAGVWTDLTPAAAGLSVVGHTHVEADITDLGSYVEAGVAETITGGWDFTTATTKFNTNFIVDAGIGAADYLDLKWNKQYVRLILDADNNEAGSFFSIHQNGTADECFRVAPSTGITYLLGASYSSSARVAEVWSDADIKLILRDSSTGGNYIDFYTTSTRRAYIGTDATNYDLYLEALTSGSDIRLEVNSGAVYLNDGGASSGRVASIATLTLSTTAPTSSAYPYGAIWGIYS